MLPISTFGDNLTRKNIQEPLITN